MNNRYTQLLLPLLLASLIPQTSYLQCPLTVNAGPDQVVCNPGGTATLSGSVIGNSLGFAWTPTTGLSNPNSLTPTATVTGPATYTLTAQAIDPTAPNLVVNGAFESGNVGFTSSYTFTPQPITPGTYTITTSPSLVLSTFPPCDDHTFGNGTGNMLLINGAGTPGANVWCQTIPVMPNTFYVMSAWVASSPISPPQLQFNVNGTPVGNPFQTSGGGCNWQQFSATWNSGASATATVCIVSLNSGNGFFGDDFALDDIAMSAACTVSDQVSVSVAQVDAVLPFSVFLPCNAAQTGIQLDGSASTSGPGISYQWTGPGILSGGNTPVATVNATGSYTLTVTYTNGPTVCTDAASIDVLPDPNIVIAGATAPNNLNCDFLTVTLDGGGSSSGPAISYAWTFVPGPGGVPPGIVSGGASQYPIVDQPGVYTLTVTNSVSGCTATASVAVTANFTQPTASASVSDTLDCLTTTLTLSGAGSSTGPSFTYFWTHSPGGGIVSGANTLNNCVVNAPGTYTLTVENQQNGCTAVAFAVVVENATPPVAAAAAPNNLDCTTPTVLLSGSGSSTGGGFTYNWTTANGNITAGAATLTPTVNLAGTYTLTVTNAANGCTATASATVSGNATVPVAEAGPAMTLDCSGNPVQLNGSGSSSGANFTYLWTTSGSGILNGETTLTPEVNAPGQYFLTVTNTVNGCTAVDSVSVTQNANAPTVVIAQPDTLDCETATLTLDASGSSSGAGIQISWTFTPPSGGAGGGFVSGETTLTPVVDAPGVYTLTLTEQGNSCTASASVTVVQDTVSPIASAGPDATLTCISPTVTLDGSGSSQGGNFTYQWAYTPASGGAGGGFVSGETTPTPKVDAPGTFTLTVTNTANACTAADTVVVFENKTPPIAGAGEPATLTCAEPVATLNGSGSSQGANFTYGWTFVPPPGGGTGGIVSGETTLTPEVDENGLYILTVTDTVNGCTAADSVAVGVFASFPTVQVAPADTLTCAQQQITLSATASTGSIFSYQWTYTPPPGGAGGGIVSGDSTLMPIIDAPGAYLLTVTNTQNGCTAVDVVVVEEDVEIPVAEAGQPFQLSCSTTNAMLNGAGSSAGPGFSYLWTTANGSFTGGINTLTPGINAPGTYTLTVTNTGNGCIASDLVIITQDANAPTADAGTTGFITCNQATATLDGSGSSSGPGISYQWTTLDGNILSGATTLAPVVDAPGTYLLAVFNTSNNCQTLSSVMVFDFTQPPGVSIGAAPKMTCVDSAVALSATASGGSSLVWNWAGPGILSGETTPSPVVNAAGTYAVTVTNQSNGCSATSMTTVTQDTTAPVAMVATPPVLTCVLDEITLNGSGSSTGPDFTYGWTFTPLSGGAGGGFVSGETTLTPTVDAPGTYILTVTNQSNGCTATATTIATANTTPPVADAGTAPSFGCAPGGTLVLDGSGSSSVPGFSYGWTTANGSILSGANTLAPTIGTPGTYTLTVTGQQNGCTATDSVTVADNGGPPVAVIAQPGMLTCALPQISLDGSGSSVGPQFSYTWTALDGSILTGETTPTPTVDAPGTYILTVTNQQNGCTATSSATVSENTTPPGATASADTITCSELEVALSGGSPTLNVTYAWTTQDGHFLFGETTPTPGVDATGTYTLTVTNPVNGCTSTASVTVVEVLLEDFVFEIKNPDCVTGVGSIVFTQTTGGTPPYRYSTDGGASFSAEPVFENLAPGVYDLVVKDEENCKLTGTAVLADPPVVTIDLEPAVTLYLGDTWQMDPQLNISPNSLAEIEWTPADGLSCTDCLRPELTPLNDAVFTLKITDVNGCTATASTAVTVLRRLDVYVPNAFSPIGDGINDVLVIFAKANQVAVVRSFKIFTRWGESVFVGSDFQPNDPAHGWDGMHRGQELDAGVYAWFAEVELLNGERVVLKGDVVLVR